jgi:hypothetical protein
MDHRKYYGNPQQIMGVEEHRLVAEKAMACGCCKFAMA